MGCNLMKGNLTDAEFFVLMDFLDQHGKMGELIRVRLRQSGFVYRRNG